MAKKVKKAKKKDAGKKVVKLQARATAKKSAAERELDAPASVEALAARAAAEGIDLKKVLDSGMPMQVMIGHLGVRKRVDTKQVDLGDVEADPDMFRVSKTIIDAKEYNAVAAVGRALKARLRVIAIPIPLFQKGVFFIPGSQYEKGKAIVAEALADLTRALDVFEESYEEIVRAAKKRLGKHWDQNDYPPFSRVRRACYIRTRYTRMEVNDRLKDVDTKAYEQQVAEWKEHFAATTVAMRDALRHEALVRTRHLFRRLLEKGDDGNPRIFRDTAVTKLTEYLDNFDAKNVTGDTDARRILGECKKLLQGADIESLRDDEKYRKATGDAVQQIHDALKDLTQGKPVRALRMPSRSTTPAAATA